MTENVESRCVMVVGSANMDLVFRCPRLPAPGETILGGEFTTAPGGKGANQAVAIGRLGGEVDFVGKLGEDSFGDYLLASLTSSGVGTSRTLRSPEASSGVAAVIVAADGENSIVVATGANAMLTPLEVSESIAMRNPAVILTQLEIPLAAVQACAGPALFLLNPAPALPLPEELIERVDVITPNETETFALTGVAPVDGEACKRAARNLHERGIRSVVLTLGARGCFVSESGRSALFSPPKVKVVDTTAAGDAFSGALAHFLSDGRDIWNATQLAGCVGALATTILGAQASMPTMEMLRTIAGNLL
jgi:ribokinase